MGVKEDCIRHLIYVIRCLQRTKPNSSLSGSSVAITQFIMALSDENISCLFQIKMCAWMVKYKKSIKRNTHPIRGWNILL